MNNKAIELLNKLKVRGKISFPKDKMSFLRAFYRKNRAHLSFSHYPIGIFAFSFVMLAFYEYFHNISFFNAAEYAAICGSVTLFPAILSGIDAYRTNFKKEPLGNFNIKMKKLFAPIIPASAVLLICLFRYQDVNDSVLKLIITAFIWGMLLIMEMNGKQLIFKETV